MKGRGREEIAGRVSTLVTKHFSCCIGSHKIKSKLKIKNESLLRITQYCL